MTQTWLLTDVETDTNICVITKVTEDLKRTNRLLKEAIHNYAGGLPMQVDDVLTPFSFKMATNNKRHMVEINNLLVTIQRLPGY